MKTQYVLKGAINNLSERIEMQNLLLDQARIMADKAIEVKEALLAEYNALVVESQTQKQTVELKNCQPTSAYAIFEDALQQGSAKKLSFVQVIKFALSTIKVHFHWHPFVSREKPMRRNLPKKRTNIACMPKLLQLV